MIDKSLRQYYQNGKEVDPYRKGLEIIAGKGKDTIQTTAPGKITARNLIKLAKKMNLPSVRKDKIVPSIKTLLKTARPSFDQKKYSGLASAFYDKLKEGEESYLDKYINRDPVRTAGGVEEWGEDYDYLTSSAAPDTALAAAPDKPFAQLVTYPQTDTALTAAPDKPFAQLVTSPQTDDTAITSTGEGETAPSYTDTQMQNIIKNDTQMKSKFENAPPDEKKSMINIAKNVAKKTSEVINYLDIDSKKAATNIVAKKLGIVGSGWQGGIYGIILANVVDWVWDNTIGAIGGDKKEGDKKEDEIWTHLVDNKGEDGDDGKEDIDEYGFDVSGDFRGEGLTLAEWEELAPPTTTVTAPTTTVTAPSDNGSNNGSSNDDGWGDVDGVSYIAKGGLAQRAPRKSLRQYYQDGKKVSPFRKGIELIAGIEQFLPSKSGKFPGFIKSGLQRPALNKLGLGALNKLGPGALNPIPGIKPMAGGIQQAFTAGIPGFSLPAEGKELRQLEARKNLEEVTNQINTIKETAPVTVTDYKAYEAPDIIKDILDKQYEFENIKTAPLAAAPDKLLAQLVTSPQTDTAITSTGEGTIIPGAVSQTPGRTTIKPYASPARPHGTQTERLETLLKDDPALGLYNLANLKGYTSITDPTERAKALKNFGYFEPDTGISYVEDLEKLGTGDKTLDKQLAATIGHEQTHALFEDQRFKDIITNMNLSKPRSAYGEGWFDEMGYFHKGVKAPSYEPEELLTRLLDVQRYGKAADSDWYFEESPYAISLHPSGEYGVEGLKKTLAPKAKEFITRAKELTTPVVQAPDVSDRHPPAPPAPTYYDEPSWSGDSGDSGSSDDFSSPGADDWSSYIAKGGLAQRAPRKSMLKGGRVDKALGGRMDRPLTGRSRDI